MSRTAIHSTALVTGLQARRDAYPEETPYRDTGCELYPACLECPLPQCRYDLPRAVVNTWANERPEQAMELRMEGKTIRQIAKELGASRRSIFRWLAAIDVRHS